MDVLNYKQYIRALEDSQPNEKNAYYIYKLSHGRPKTFMDIMKASTRVFLSCPYCLNYIDINKINISFNLDRNIYYNGFIKTSDYYCITRGYLQDIVFPRRNLYTCNCDTDFLIDIHNMQDCDNITDVYGLIKIPVIKILKKIDAADTKYIITFNKLKSITDQLIGYVYEKGIVDIIFDYTSTLLSNGYIQNAINAVKMSKDYPRIWAEYKIELTSEENTEDCKTITTVNNKGIIIKKKITHISCNSLVWNQAFTENGYNARFQYDRFQKTKAYYLVLTNEGKKKVIQVQEIIDLSHRCY